MEYTALPKCFWETETDTFTQARALLGKVLVCGDTAGRIVETEVYGGVTDRACHAFGGRRTARTETLYGPPGRAYIYLIYGMYCCLNVTAQPEGTPECVLIRALEPLWGLEQMGERRRSRSGKLPKPEALCSGPGRLCQALGIDRSLNGTDLFSSAAFYLAEGETVPPERVEVTPRIGIDYAKEARDYPWRFCERDSIWLSR